MSKKLHIDFETRSTVELSDVGIDNYARHPTTDPWCLAFAFDDEEPDLWRLGDNSTFVLGEVFKYIRSGGEVHAHNADFELDVWNKCCAVKYGWPVLPHRQTVCTMALAYVMGLPGALENAAAALGVPFQKDLVGRRLSLQMAAPREIKPNGEIVWWGAPDNLIRLYEYCKQDVRVERELSNRLLPLSPEERRIWDLDYEINQRGVYIDTAGVEKALKIVALESSRLNDRLSMLTGGAVGAATEIQRLLEFLKNSNFPMSSLQKADVKDALDYLDTVTENTDIPPVCKQVLEIRQEAGKTSTAKFKTLQTARSTHDNRLRDTLQYHAAATGRWGGRKFQPQNLPRPKLSHEEIDAILDWLPTWTPEQAVERIGMVYGPPMQVMSDCLRGMVAAPPGKDLVAGDFSNIEGRGIAWLAGEEWKLQAFRDQDAGTGPEIYQLTAAKIYHKDPKEITKKSPERQIGKVAELACGYQGGVGAFQTMAKTYLVKVPDDQAEVIKNQWREAHPKIVQYWWDLDSASYEAVMRPGTVIKAGPAHRQVQFRVAGSFLFCLLPSNRVLTYPYPCLKFRETPWGEEREQIHYRHVSERNKWEETHTYGGKLAENITQAICRDLLAHALLRLELWEIVLHVHDEIVVEIDAYKPASVEKQMWWLMEQPPAWATGFPIKVEGWRGKRYRK